MSRAVTDAITRRFIARPDVKAIQFGTGGYMPVRDRITNTNIPWTRADIDAHVAGTASYGHYLLNKDNLCKLFAFDIDLEPTNKETGIAGWLPNSGGPDSPWTDIFPIADLRSAWHQRNHPARAFMKQQFRLMAHVLAKGIQDNLGIETAVAYSGNKGVHVYGFTGLIEAGMARDGANLVLEALGTFAEHRGSVFFKHTNTDPIDGYPNLSIEVFPKQVKLDGGDSYGNLMRLPLGRNLKAKDPAFFVDMTAPMNELTPVDALRALSPGYNLWQTAQEAAAVEG